MASVSERLPGWPEERPDQGEQPAPYRRGTTVRRVEELTTEERLRIAERRDRHAAEDRAAAAVVAHPPRRRTSPLAIAAFVTAFLLPFVGLLLAIIGAARLGRESKTSGRGLSIAAIVISLLAIYLFALLL